MIHTANQTLPVGAALEPRSALHPHRNTLRGSSAAPTTEETTQPWERWFHRENTDFRHSTLAPRNCFHQQVHPCI